MRQIIRIQPHTLHIIIFSLSCCIARLNYEVTAWKQNSLTQLEKLTNIYCTEEKLRHTGRRYICMYIYTKPLGMHPVPYIQSSESGLFN